ncbi:hypothetical protein CFY91_10490, partial [Pseudomonas fluvialis]|uniref:retention module-containing protein n=1 Tax=Pseudomonas fluvialis TaxID=1793966 RepID=UPI000B9CC4A8
MSVIAATLKQVFGNAYVIASDGSKRPALEGEHLFNGEQLLTESGASAVLQLANGERLDVASDSLWQAAPATNEAVLASEDDLPSDLEQALAAGFDPTLELEPTAAGPAAGGAGGAGGGHSFILLSETGAQVEATIGFNTSGLDSSAGLLREEQVAQASLSDNGSIDLTAPTLTVSAPDNSNDSTPTLTGSSDQIGGTVTLTVTDANGATQNLSATVQTDGSWSVAVSTPLAEGSYSVVAQVSDAAGNTAQATDNATVDTTATAAPTVTITADANNDQLLSSTELGAATTVAVTIGLPAGAVAGDTLTVTDGTTPQV